VRTNKLIARFGGLMASLALTRINVQVLGACELTGTSSSDPWLVETHGFVCIEEGHAELVVDGTPTPSPCGTVVLLRPGMRFAIGLDAARRSRDTD
jgi:hypothetical protein